MTRLMLSRLFFGVVAVLAGAVMIAAATQAIELEQTTIDNDQARWIVAAVAGVIFLACIGIIVRSLSRARRAASASGGKGEGDTADRRRGDVRGGRAASGPPADADTLALRLKLSQQIRGAEATDTEETPLLRPRPMTEVANPVLDDLNRAQLFAGHLDEPLPPPAVDATLPRREPGPPEPGPSEAGAGPSEAVSAEPGPPEPILSEPAPRPPHRPTASAEAPAPEPDQGRLLVASEPRPDPTETVTPRQIRSLLLAPTDLRRRSRDRTEEPSSGDRAYESTQHDVPTWVEVTGPSSQDAPDDEPPATGRLYATGG